MSRILYGVMGDARGHVNRALAVAGLMKGHDFLFAGGGLTAEVARNGYKFTEIPMLATFHRQGRVSLIATVFHAAKMLCAKSLTVRQLSRIIQDYNPDLILTDYEFFTPLAAKRIGRKCVSLDHQHILTNCLYEEPQSQKLSRALTCWTVRTFFSNADRFLITSFYDLPPSEPGKTEVFPAIVRDAVRKLIATNREHGLIYLSDKTFPGLLPQLKQAGRRFIVYGLGARPDDGTLIFREDENNSFLEDLASCSYVISNAGHGLISEALYLGKPVLCLPISLLYEQFLNAHFLSQLGYGEMIIDPDSLLKTIAEFESRLGQYRDRIKTSNCRGNDLIVSRLTTLLKGE